MENYLEVKRQDSQFKNTTAGKSPSAFAIQRLAKVIIHSHDAFATDGPNQNSET